MESTRSSRLMWRCWDALMGTGKNQCLLFLESTMICILLLDVFHQDWIFECDKTYLLKNGGILHVDKYV